MRKIKVVSTFRSDCEKKRKSIAKMRKQFPCYTLQQIGDEFGVGRERVRQVLNLENVETRSLQRLITGKKCQRCDDIIPKGRQDYCVKCRYELHHVQITCDHCGRLFWRAVSSVLHYSFLTDNRRQHYFCDRTCFGKWTGKNNGFVKNPHNIKNSWSQKIILHNLFVDLHQLINVADSREFDWESIFSFLSPGVILCFEGKEDRKKIRYRLYLASRYHEKHLITSIMDDRLYAREK